MCERGVWVLTNHFGRRYNDPASPRWHVSHCCLPFCVTWPRALIHLPPPKHGSTTGSSDASYNPSTATHRQNDPTTTFPGEPTEREQRLRQILRPVAFA